MVLGNPLENKLEDVSQKLEDMKSQRKLVELDLEKRILLLENSLNSIQKILGAIKDFESLKDTLSHMETIQNKLREIEDASLISRLEAVQSDERLALIDEAVKDLKGKMGLLSDAIEMLGESGAKLPGTGLKIDLSEIDSLKAELNSMKEAISKLASNVVPPTQIEGMAEELSGMKNSVQSIDSDLKAFAGIVREKIEIMERDMQRQKAPQIPPELAGNIDAMQKNVNQLKDVMLQLVGQVGTQAKKILELKSLQDERREYDSFKRSIEALEKDVLSLKKEMDLDRTMYPENLMKLEKELSAIKSTKKNAASTADVQKLADDMMVLIDEFSRLKESMPKYEESMGSVLKNNDSIKSGISEALTTIKGVMSENAGLRKDVVSLKNQVAEIQSLRKADEDIPQTEVPAAEEEGSKLIRGLQEKIGRLEKLQQTAPMEAVNRVIDDLRLLRREVATVKERLSSIPEGGAVEGRPEDESLQEENASIMQRVDSLEEKLKGFKLTLDSLVSNNEQIAEDLKQMGLQLAEMRHKQPIIID